MTSALSVDPTAAADLAAPAPTAGRSMRVIGGIAALLSLVSALMTFIVLADLTPIAPTHRVVVTLLMINGVTVLILLSVIAREVWQVVLARRRGRAAARLHIRIVGLFSVIAAVPAILVAIVASVTLDRGLDRLFSTRTKTVIQNSMYVANAYLREHAQSIRGDIMAMAIDVGRAKPLFDQDRDRFRQFLTAQAKVRGLSSAIIVGSETEVIERADVKAEHENIMPSTAGLASTSETEPRIGIVFEANAVASMLKLRGYENAYLHVTRPLDPQVVAQLREAQASVSDFASLESRRLGVQLAFALMYTVIALTVLLSAAWLGLNFANRLVAPIRRLIGAANIVSTGNLYVQVPIQRSEGDLAQLGETFNKMTSELRTQRDDITRTRDLIDQRRRFTEAVLAGASAGVIGVDADGPHQHPQPLRRTSDRPVAGRGGRAAAHRHRARAQGHFCHRANRRAAPGTGPGDDQPGGARAQSLGARHHRAVGRPGAWLRGDARRHHRAGAGAAHFGLGRRRAAHRARDQESADPDPALGRTAAPQVRPQHHRRSRRVPPVHRHDHPAGRRHQAHGRRVLQVRAHAQAGDGGGRRRRHGAADRVPDARRQCRHRHRARDRRGPHAGAVRPPADLAGADQHHQERDRGDRLGAAGRGPQRPHQRPGRPATAATSSST